MNDSPFAGTESVLVVDDHSDVREYASEALRAFGYWVVAVSDTREAMRLVGDSAIALDALVTDLAVPLVGGAQLAKEAKRLRPLLKVLFVSGHSVRTATAGKPADRDVNFLEKPFSPEQLARSLRRALDERTPPLDEIDR